MQVTVTAKTRILPTQEQAALLDATLDAYRDGCELVSTYVHEHRDTVQKSVHTANYATLRSRLGLGSQMACSVTKTVLARYKALKTAGVNRKNGKWTQPRFRKPQLDLCYNRDYTLKGDTFSVNTLQGRVKMRFCKEGMEQYLNGAHKLGTAKLVKKHGKYYLHIPVTLEVPELDDKDVNNVVGIDRGINFLVSTYDSKGRSGFVSGRKVKAKRAHYKNLRKQLQKKGTPSARRRLKRIGNRENRWMNDMNHCIAKALVANNPSGTIFVLEDLTGVRNATEKVRVRDRYVMVSWSFYDLEQKLVYKAQLNHQKVVKVNPAYTSQQCPKCGHTERANRDKHNHLFTCKNCGYRSNDDRVAAMNLYRKGIDLLVPCDTVAPEHDSSAQGAVNHPHADATPPSRKARKGRKAGAAPRRTRTAGQSQAATS